MFMGLGLATPRSLSNFLLACIGAFFILFATHYHNAYSDFRRGIDQGETGKAYTSASTILPRGLVSPREVIVIAVSYYLLGFLFYLWLAVEVSILCIIPALLGITCGISYNTYGKYIGLGEPFLGISFGLATVLAGYVTSTGCIEISPLLVSFIPGLLWALVYTMDQAQDIDTDVPRGIRNLASTLLAVPFPLSRYLEFGVFMVLLSHIFFILVEFITPLTFTAVITIPVMFSAILTADGNRRLSAQLLLLSFGLYVTIIDLCLLVA